ncbi:MAG TPA: hypothetical protein PLF63_13390, partial [Rubrivivax sp.]|nr:hypothetical protein [Rubrivivax sp.]
ALTADRATPRRDGRRLSLPVAAATKLFAGSIVCVNASNLAVKGAVSTTLKAAGVAVAQADNSAGAAGDIRVEVERGLWLMANSASTDQIALADIGASCYIVDDQTVAKTNGSSTRSVAGIVRDVDAAGVWVEF